MLRGTCVILYSQAADENKKNNYEKALSLHKKAQWFNGGGFVFIVAIGCGFFLLTLVGGVVALVLFVP